MAYDEKLAGDVIFSEVLSAIAVMTDTLDIENNLIGLWRLNKGSGVTAYDTSGNGNDGALEGTRPNWITRKSLEFGGVNQRVDCGNPAPLDNLGNGSFWISFWMKSKDTVPLVYGRIFAKEVSGNDLIILSSHSNVNRLYFSMKSGGVGVGTFFGVTPLNPPFDTIFNHIVLEINRTTDKALVYVNTVKETTEIDISSCPADCSNAANISWGAQPDGGSPYEGRLNKCHIFTGVPTQEQIDDLFEMKPVTDELIGLWEFDEETGLIAHDSSIYGNDGNLEGDMSTGDWKYPKSGNCIDLPGADERIDCGNGAPLDQIGNGSFWIPFWMKSKDAVPNNYGALFDKYQDVLGFITLSSYAHANRVFLEIKKGGTGVAGPFSVSSAPFDTEWNHIVLVINRIIDKALLYMNTVKDTTEIDISALPFDISNTGRLAWGAANDGWAPFEGGLDEMRIYTGEPTQAKIDYLYNHPEGRTGGQIAKDVILTETASKEVGV